MDAFEVITESQGIPKHGEADPTPMIALMWPIFYGLMFADMGHGLLLMGMGLLFKFKGQGTLSRWGMLIAISGASAAIAGGHANCNIWCFSCNSRCWCR
jgi:V/A-type H+-transporting ATPase subunit I